jgi:hypothetical protein
MISPLEGGKHGEKKKKIKKKKSEEVPTPKYKLIYGGTSLYSRLQTFVDPGSGHGVVMP